MIIGFFIVLGMDSCRKEEIYEYDGIGNANSYLFSLMNQYYLWYNYMPSVNPSLYRNPEKLMDALLYKTYDNWSFVAKKAEFDSYFSAGEATGYGFSAIANDSNDLFIAYVIANSPFQQNGVERGYKFLKIDNQSVDANNINILLEDAPTHFFELLKTNGDTLRFNASRKVLTVNSILYSKIIDTVSKKIAYMVLNTFISTTKDELDAKFEVYEMEGITDLILDLRYNGGGEVAIARYLCSNLAPDITKGKVFCKYVFNEKNENMNTTDTFDIATHNLKLNRLVVITTSATASASEMVINCMYPYFSEVIIVGSTTHGKPVGMIPVEYGSYYFVPVMFRTYNASDEGDYFSGLTASIDALDDFTKNFGDSNEASFKAALNYIITNAKSGVLKTPMKSYIVKPNSGLMHEIDLY